MKSTKGLFLLILFGFFFSASKANVFIVTDNGGGSSINTLNWAITQANSNPGTDTIDASNITNISLIANLPTITDTVTIYGPFFGPLLTITSNQSPIVEIGNTVVTLMNLDLAYAGPLNQSVVINNHKLTMKDCMIHDGGASSGGAIRNNYELYLNKCTLYNNNAESEGGAIYASSSAILTDLTNCTISGNNAGGSVGAGIHLDGNGNCNINHCTIYNNTSGDGITQTGAGELTITGSIIYGHSFGSDISTTADLNLIGNSIIGTYSAGMVGGIGTPLDMNPLIEPLVNNGGRTLTHAINNSSPAINGTSGDPLLRDQRGYFRVGEADIGSFEHNGFGLILQNAIAGHPFCGGDEFDVTILSMGIVGGTFNIELSNILGTFSPQASVRIIGSGNGNTITCTIPDDVLTGNKYRVRVSHEPSSLISDPNPKPFTINQKPAVIGTDLELDFCLGETIDLTSALTGRINGFNVYWHTTSDGPGILDGNFNHNINTSVTGTYILFVSQESPQGCQSNKRRITVNINALPTVTFNGSTTLCEGKSSTLTADEVGADSYTWDLDGTISNGNNFQINAPNDIGKSLTLTVLKNGCSDTSTGVEIDQSPSVNASFVGVTDLCVGDDLSLSTGVLDIGGNIPSYEWLKGSSTLSDSITLEIDNVQLTDGGDDYELIISDSLCSFSTGPFSVTVNESPVATFTGAISLCGSEQSDLTADEETADLFTWNLQTGEKQGKAITITSVDVGDMTLTVTKGGCVVSSDNFVIESHTSPTVSNIVTTNLSSCTNPNGAISFDISPVDSYSVAWYDGQDPTGSNNIATGSDPSITDLRNGDYSAIVTSNNTACFTSNSFVISTSLDIPGDIPVIAPPSTGTTICGANNITLSGTGTLNIDEAFQWYYNGTAINGENNSIHVASQEGDYHLTIKNTITECESNRSDIISIDKADVPDVTISTNGSSNICDGKEITLTAIVDAPTTEIIWSTGETTNSITITEAGDYFAQAYTGATCNSISPTITINSFSSPKASFIAPTEASFRINVDFIDESELIDSDNSYLWDFGDDNTSTITSNVAHTYISPGNYTVSLTVTSASGCSNTFKQDIAINDDFPVKVLNIITPNGDGTNDFLYIDHIEDYPNSEVTLINRWGLEVYSSKNFTNPTAEGVTDQKTLDPGTYICIVKIGGIDQIIKQTVSVVK